MAEVHELSQDECKVLLASKTVGRIGMVTPEGLRILPVSYTIAGGQIVFRTLPYGVVAANVADAEVAFEVDELEEDLRTGWSVLAVGRCARIESPVEVGAVRAEADPEPWAEGTRSLYFRIDWTLLTGRQIGDLPRGPRVPRSRSAP